MITGKDEKIQAKKMGLPMILSGLQEVSGD